MERGLLRVTDMVRGLLVAELVRGLCRVTDMVRGLCRVADSCRMQYPKLYVTRTSSHIHIYLKYVYVQLQLQRFIRSKFGQK